MPQGHALKEKSSLLLRSSNLKRDRVVEKQFFIQQFTFDVQKATPLHNQRCNWNCLGQFRGFPWNQTTNVHRGSTLITRVITRR